MGAVFNYSDGVSHTLERPEFLDRLEGHIGNSGPIFVVHFSGPAGDVRVIGVKRSAILQTNQPTAAQFTASLVGKYGQPAGMSRGNKGQPVWEAAGETSCIRIRDYKGDVIIDVAAGLGEGLMTNASAEQFLTSRGTSTTGRGLLPADVAHCGAYLSYWYPGDPISTFSAELYDLGAMVATERSRTAWVSQLQDEAVRKRAGQGQAPKL